MKTSTELKIGAPFFVPVILIFGKTLCNNYFNFQSWIFSLSVWIEVNDFGIIVGDQPTCRHLQNTQIGFDVLYQKLRHLPENYNKDLVSTVLTSPLFTVIN